MQNKNCDSLLGLASIYDSVSESYCNLFDLKETTYRQSSKSFSLRSDHHHLCHIFIYSTIIPRKPITRNISTIHLALMADEVTFAASPTDEDVIREPVFWIATLPLWVGILIVVICVAIIVLAVIRARISAAYRKIRQRVRPTEEEYSVDLEWDSYLTKGIQSSIPAETPAFEDLSESDSLPGYGEGLPSYPEAAHLHPDERS